MRANAADRTPPLTRDQVRALSRASVILAAANAILITLISTYDVRLGPVHLAAHGLFKPLLYVSGAALLVSLIGAGTAPAVSSSRWSPGGLLMAAVAIALYIPSFFVSADNNDWNHYYTSAAITSLRSAAHLFTGRQPDGFYRPLTFLSLWVDYAIFHTSNWGYHLQNVAMHVVNALLVAKLARGLNLNRWAANFAAILFATAAVNYEPVLWPGARFDLLAAFFTLGALLVFLEYVKQPDADYRSLACMLALFAAGVLSKESAYCFPLLMIFLLATHETWKLPALSRRRLTVLVASVTAVTCLFLAIRLAIYGGLGGYPDASGLSPHFELRFTTLTSFFTRALPVPPFAPNSSVPLPGWAMAAVIGFALWACVHAFTCVGSWRRNGGFLAAALLAALPAANLVDWVGPMMHNTRYLYLPSIWIFLLIAAATGSSALARAGLIVLVLANSIGVLHNISSYRWIDPGVRPAATQVRRNLTDRDDARATAAAIIRSEMLRDFPRSDCRTCPEP